MINIATVHWQTPKWIDAQLHYVSRSLDVPYRVFAALNGIDDPVLWKRFHSRSVRPIFRAVHAAGESERRALSGRIFDGKIRAGQTGILQSKLCEVMERWRARL